MTLYIFCLGCFGFCGYFVLLAGFLCVGVGVSFFELFVALARALRDPCSVFCPWGSGVCFSF